MVTRSPRSLSRRPRLDAVRPLPRLDATPPVTKRCLVETGRDECGAVTKLRLPLFAPGGKSAGPRGIRISAARTVPGEQRRTDSDRTPLTRNKAPDMGSHGRDGVGCVPRAAGVWAARPWFRRLAGLGEAGQRHRAGHGEDEPGHGQPGQAVTGRVAEEHDAHDRGR